ncbi:YggS family pyridoxal phosphate-dependent enzyme [Oligoflexia bacterium]|nr:YggS family pyridoxal phosphate-dependent enzyme [Oligoflexia bacterium]
MKVPEAGKSEQNVMQAQLQMVLEQIADAARRSSRDPADVKLVAVSKKQPVTKMAIVLKSWPTKDTPVIFGESYVQEFKKKRAELEGDYLAHLIGPLQSNKAKDAVKCFDLIESVHSPKIALALNAEAEKIGKLQDVYLQVNISDDINKAGFTSEALLKYLADEFGTLKNLRLCGLMTITRYYMEKEDARPDFGAVRDLKERVSAQVKHLDINVAPSLELSMGMSADFDIAIEEGATVVRVGTALFGERILSGAQI